MIEAFFAEHVATKLKPKSVAGYKLALERLRAAHGGLKAEAVTRAHIGAVHAKLRDKPYAANRALATWSKLFTWGESRELLPRGHAKKGVSGF